jgi:hypothetical protein
MSIVVEQALAAIRDNYPSPHLHLLAPLVDDLNATRAENSCWRDVAEQVDATTPDELETNIAVLGLSITIGEYGTWGRETLAYLFSELGIQPGDDLATAVGRLRPEPRS